MKRPDDVLAALGLHGGLEAIAVGSTNRSGEGPALGVRCPIDGRELARFTAAGAPQADAVVAAAAAAFAPFREIPAPRRGELVRRIGVRLRELKEPLADLVSLEVGKIRQEALGEVQEMIDVCDFAVGLSRQLHGLTIASERARHRLSEQWHPLGPVAVITAFNFPVAVWAWNAALALVCGDPVIWKPSEKAPLTAIACHRIAAAVAAEMGDVPEGVVSLVVGKGPEVGARLAANEKIPLVSATGSVRMGRSVGQVVGARLGRSLLELGGNNALVLAPSADVELALRAVVFAAFGTCGQRCTSLRRLVAHESLHDGFVSRLKGVTEQLRIGDPTAEGTLVGPLIDEAAFDAMQRAISEARRQGGTAWGGERLRDGVPAGGVYVRPAIVEIAPDAPILQEETFAPVLFVCRYRDLDEAIALNNGVPQGLSSAIFTNDMREAERFCSASGSDCGITNVNAGTSGAEIGGAFGGEKQTGGGRESGSDAWKAYMRRATNTINYGTELPLAQGIRFDV